MLSKHQNLEKTKFTLFQSHFLASKTILTNKDNYLVHEHPHLITVTHKYNFGNKQL